MSEPDAPETPAALARRLDRLPPDRIARFVAELWEATGRAASVEGSAVELASTGGESPDRYAAGTPEEPEAVDGAIVPGGRRPAWFDPERHDLIDAETLHQRAVFASAPEARERLYRDHLGCPAPASPSPGKARGDDANTGGPDGTTSDTESAGFGGRFPDGIGTSGVRIGAVLVVVAFLGATLGWGAIGGPQFGGPGDALGAGTETGTPTPTQQFLIDTQVALPTATVTETATRTEPTPVEGVPPIDVNASRYFALRPTCERPPGLVVQIQIGAFRYNDRDPPLGLLTVWAFLTEPTQEVIGDFDAFIDRVEDDPFYRPLLRSRSADYGPVSVENRTAIQRVEVTTQAGRHVTYRWTLVKSDRPSFAGCWLTTDITRTGPGENTTDRP